MRWNTWILFGVALALLLGVGAMVSRQARTSPAEFLAAVEKRIADGRYDREQTLLNLDQVLARATEAGDGDLQVRVLLRRGRLLMELGATDRARADLLAVAERLPDDPAVENDLVELETRAGDFAAAERRVRRRLEQSPASSAGWARLGRLHRLAAAKAAEDAEALLARALASDARQRAAVLLDRMFALDPRDPARPGLGDRVRALMPAAQADTLQQVLALADRGSEALRRSREACAESLVHGVEIDALAGLIDLYRRAGRANLGIDLATATLHRTEVRSDPEIGRALLRALNSTGRHGYGAEIARPFVQRNIAVDAAFFDLCARTALRARRWDVLISAANGLRGVGSSFDLDAANFYLGMGLISSDQDDLGRMLQRRFVASNAPDPVPGARAMAWRSIAKASRVLGEPDVEAEALRGALELDPGADGELWLRLSELQMATPHGGYRLPESRFARGMSYLPERTEELLPRWIEIGEKELASIGLDPVAVRQGLVRDRIWKPSSDATPYELFRLAELHFEHGDDLRVAAYLRKLLQDLPGFVPALDLSIRVARRRGRTDELLDLVATRVQAAGRTSEIVEILRGFALEDLASRDVHRLMRADPEYFGRIVAADTLARGGSTRAALDLLSTIAPKDLGDEAALLSGRLWLADGDPARAHLVLRPIGENLLSMPGAVEVAVRAAAFSGARDDLRGLLVMAARSPSLARARKLALADLALAAGELPGARLLLRTLDAAAATRGGDVCVRLAAAATLAGEGDAAREALARADAFDTHGAADAVALFAAWHDGRLDALRAAALRLATRNRPTEPLAVTALALLQDRPAAAREHLEQIPAGERAREPRWALLRTVADQLEGGEATALHPALGTRAAAEARIFVVGPDGQRDPRWTAALVLASVLPPGEPFAHAAIGATSAEAHGRLWPAWIAAVLRARLENRADLRQALESALAAAPDFAPAWALLEADQFAGSRDPVAYAQFRERRARGLGAATAAPGERGEDRARLLEMRGEWAAAIEAADRALAEHPRPAELERIRGRCLLALGRPAEAADAFAAASGADPAPRDAARAAGEWIGAIEDALAGDPPMERARAEDALARLRDLRPADPRPVLALARLDVTRDPSNPTLGVRRALARLDAFRLDHKDQALEDLASGSAFAWARFAARIDPEYAEELVRRELDLSPGHLSTWLAHAHVLEAGGAPEEALAGLRRTARIWDDGAVLREVLRLSGEGEIAPEEIEAARARILAREGRAAADPALELLVARCYANQGPRHIRQAYAAGERAHVESAPADVRRAAAVLMALARMARGAPEDLAAAAALLAEAGAAQDPLERSYLDALRGIAGQTSKP